MTLFIWILIGVFAAWRLTWDITSCTPLKEEGMPDVCEYNSEGPFRLYDGIRFFFAQDFMPAWAQRGAKCPYCVSFWASFFVAIFLPVYTGLDQGESLRLWFVLGVGMSGVIAFVFRIFQNFYGIDAQGM